MTEVERLVVKLIGDGSSYEKMAKDAIQVSENLKAAADSLSVAFDKAVPIIASTHEAIDKLNTVIDKMAPALNQASTSLDKAGASAEKTAPAIDKVVDAAVSVAEETVPAIDRMVEVFDKATPAVDGLANAVVDAGEKGAPEIEELTEAIEDVQPALEDANDAAKDLSGTIGTDIPAAAADAVDALEELGSTAAETLGMSKYEADEFMKALSAAVEYEKIAPSMSKMEAMFAKLTQKISGSVGGLLSLGKYLIGLGVFVEIGKELFQAFLDIAQSIMESVTGMTLLNEQIERAKELTQQLDKRQAFQAQADAIRYGGLTDKEKREETTRNIKNLTEQTLPQLRQSLEIAKGERNEMGWSKLTSGVTIKAKDEEIADIQKNIAKAEAELDKNRLEQLRFETKDKVDARNKAEKESKERWQGVIKSGMGLGGKLGEGVGSAFNFLGSTMGQLPRGATLPTSIMGMFETGQESKGVHPLTKAIGDAFNKAGEAAKRVIPDLINKKLSETVSSAIRNKESTLKSAVPKLNAVSDLLGMGGFSLLSGATGLASQAGMLGLSEKGQKEVTQVLDRSQGVLEGTSTSGLGFFSRLSEFAGGMGKVVDPEKENKQKDSTNLELMKGNTDEMKTALLQMVERITPFN